MTRRFTSSRSYCVVGFRIRCVGCRCPHGVKTGSIRSMGEVLGPLLGGRSGPYTVLAPPVGECQSPWLQWRPRAAGAVILAWLPQPADSRPRPRSAGFDPSSCAPGSQDAGHPRGVALLAGSDRKRARASSGERGPHPVWAGEGRGQLGRQGPHPVWAGEGRGQLGRAGAAPSLGG